MKLYVVPTKRKCNASCGFCITSFRDLKGREFLEVGDLEKSLDMQIDKIEITGGGEPLLNPDIGKIIQVCSQKAHTQLYTNGVLAETADLEGLDLLCISRAHNDDKINQRIMGINYDFQAIQRRGFLIKLSLLLHSSGVSSAREVEEYLDWANIQSVSKVVVRQMMPYHYSDNIKNEFVGAKKVFDDLGVDSFRRVDEGAEFDWKGMEVIFKYFPYDCDSQVFLHADGRLGGME